MRARCDPETSLGCAVSRVAVVLTGSPALVLNRFAEFGKDIVFSAEKACFPDKDVRSLYPLAPTKFRFLNAGTYIGRCSALRRMLEEVTDPAFLHVDAKGRTHAKVDDQRCLTGFFLRHAATAGCCALDHRQGICMCVFWCARSYTVSGAAQARPLLHPLEHATRID